MTGFYKPFCVFRIAKIILDLLVTVGLLIVLFTNTFLHYKSVSVQNFFTWSVMIVFKMDTDMKTIS